MARKQTYICLDTNIYIHCALARRKSINSDFLRKIFSSMDKIGARLLVPEVVKLELKKVLDREIDKIHKEIGAVQEIIKGNDTFGFDTKGEFDSAISAARKHIDENSEQIYREIIERMEDVDKSVIVDFSSSGLINDAIRIAIQGNKPSKNSNTYDLLQADCLIAASIKQFKDSNPKARIILCSDNKHDFACSEDQDGHNPALHKDLIEYLGDIEFFVDPVMMFKNVLENAQDDAEEVEPLIEEYKRIKRSDDRSKYEYFITNTSDTYRENAHRIGELLNDSYRKYRIDASVLRNMADSLDSSYLQSVTQQAVDFDTSPETLESVRAAIQAAKYFNIAPETSKAMHDAVQAFKNSYSPLEESTRISDLLMGESEKGAFLKAVSKIDLSDDIYKDYKNTVLFAESLRSSANSDKSESSGKSKPTGKSKKAENGESSEPPEEPNELEDDKPED